MKNQMTIFNDIIETFKSSLTRTPLDAFFQMLYRAEKIGIAYEDLTTILRIFSEHILQMPTPLEEMNSLVTQITNATSHNGILAKMKQHLQSFHRTPTDTFKTKYNFFLMVICKVTQPLRMLSIAEKEETKKQTQRLHTQYIVVITTMELIAHLMSIAAFYSLIHWIRSLPKTPSISNIVIFPKNLTKTILRSSPRSYQTTFAPSCLP